MPSNTSIRSRARRYRLAGQRDADSLKKLLIWGGGAAFLAWLLWPKSARAEERKLAAEETPTTKDKALTVAPVAGGGAPREQPVFADKATGIAIAGPSMSLESKVDKPHLVASGESWSNIASRAYGDARWWPYLWDWNRAASPSKYANPDQLAQGDQVYIAPMPGDEPVFRAAVFARFDAHRAYWLCKTKGGKDCVMSPSVLVVTAVAQGAGAGDASSSSSSTGDVQASNEIVNPDSVSSM